MRHRVNLLHTHVDKVNLTEAGLRVTEFVHSGSPHQIVAANLDFLRLGSQDPTFRDLMNTADLVIPDGMPLVWASRLLGNPLPHRICGIDLMLESCRQATIHGHRVFLLGAQSGVAETTANVLRHRYPGLRIVGTYSPPPLPMTVQEEDKTIRLIQEMQPDILFVAFGAPAQDFWIRKNMPRLGVPVCMGVGGAFDMLARRVKRAPEWMQDYGLEWLCRLVQEPTRLWRRYFVEDLPIFFQLLAQRNDGGRAMDGAEFPALSVPRHWQATVEKTGLSSVEESGTPVA